MLFLLTLVLGACGGKSTVTGTPEILTTTPSPTATLPPTATPTLEPLGSQSNPFVLGAVIDADNGDYVAALQQTAARIAANMNVTVIARPYNDYQSVLQDLQDGRLHITFLPPFTYLNASRRGLAEAVLLTNHFGVYRYGSQILANVASGYTPYYDPKSGQNAVSAAEALAQLQDARACYVDDQSGAGYVVPAGSLIANQVTAQPPIFLQSHTNIIRALYIKGICDFGATYAISGDPRTASAVIDDLPDATDRIIILWRSDAVIPNLNISLLAGMSEANRQGILQAFSLINQTSEGKAILSYAAGGYQVDDLQVIDDAVYEPLRILSDAVDLNLNEMVGK